MKRAAFALVASLFISAGCQTLGVEQKTEVSQPQPPIGDAKKLISERKYSDALTTLQKALHDGQYGASAPDIRYLIATVYVAADNPQRDYSQALVEFDEFLRLYPDHERAVEAKSWRHAIKLILEAKKENERLRKSIEGLKELDVRQEQKRLGK